ncbi:MAG: hypothetical protein LAP13_26110 [Acidobacteriia bacterium]|nr:hypothetical protein [Terriglobia bacterium]
MSASSVSSARAHPAASARQRKRPGNPQGTLQDVSKLPAEMRTLVDEMLVDGATFEDVAEAVQERGGIRLALRAVQRYFRSNPALQQQRIKHQLETAQALKEAVGNPESAQKDLVDAVLLTGLMRVNRRDVELTAQNAVVDHYRRQNLRIRENQNRIRMQKLRLDKQYINSRLETEKNKQDAIKAKLAEMQLLMETRNGRKELGAEALKKIQEIYGLIREEKTESQLVGA